MNKTATKKMSVKMKRALHAHANLITLDDGVAVCPGCGAVIPAKAVA